MTTKKTRTKKKPARKPTTRKKRAALPLAPMAAASAPVGLPKLGEVFPGQGGVFAGLIRDADGTVRALVVGTDKACSFNGKWGEYGKDVKGAGSPSDGRANTAAMEAAGSPIAKRARAIKVDGHADFYIPSRRELALIEANVAHLCNKLWHWSSTQCSSFYAWMQDFAYGVVYTDYKANYYRVRAVRSLVIQ